MMRDYRCPKCLRLLFRGNLRGGCVEIRCRDCKEIVTFGKAATPPATDWHGMRRDDAKPRAASLTTSEG